MNGLRSGYGFALAIATGLGLAGCPGDDGGGSGGQDTESADTTAGSTTDPDTNGMTGPSMTTSPGGTGTGTTTTPGLDSTDGGGMDTGGFITAGSSDGPGTPQPNGAQCASPDECESGFCYEVPMFGGVCSECTMDADCEMGTCSIDVNAMYAVCTDGGLGAMCDSTRGCQDGLVCEPLVDSGGAFPADFCSECGEKAPCPRGETCSPVYDQANFQGYHECVEPGSVRDGGGCPVDENGMGDGSVCMSGECGIADVFGVVQIGVCGECDSDEDCMPPETCTPPTADQAGTTPSVCE